MRISYARSISAFAFSAIAAAFALSASPAKAATAPYCIQQYNTNGASATEGSCRYFSLADCQQAAAASRGNCVGNIDYRGGSAPAEPERRMRRVR